MDKNFKTSQSVRKGYIKKYRFKNDTISLFKYRYHTMMFEEQEKEKRVLTDYEKSLIYKICELEIYMLLLDRSNENKEVKENGSQCK